MTLRSRGRPPKFGRPARLVALTLPEDTIVGLKAIDVDLARAVVALLDRAQGRTSPVIGDWGGPVDLAQVNDFRALIVIDPVIFRDIPGCSVIPLFDGRAFLALDPGRTLADVELSVADRLEEEAVPDGEREALGALRQALRDWRRDDSLSFHTRSIVLVERAAGWRA
jgi:hypothetical protein